MRGRERGVLRRRIGSCGNWKWGVKRRVRLWGIDWISALSLQFWFSLILLFKEQNGINGCAFRQGKRNGKTGTRAAFLIFKF